MTEESDPSWGQDGAFSRSDLKEFLAFERLVVVLNDLGRHALISLLHEFRREKPCGHRLVIVIDKGVHYRPTDWTEAFGYAEEVFVGEGGVVFHMGLKFLQFQHLTESFQVGLGFSHVLLGDDDVEHR